MGPVRRRWVSVPVPIRCHDFDFNFGHSLVTDASLNSIAGIVFLYQKTSE